jgi:hypothetical protein
MRKRFELALGVSLATNGAAAATESFAELVVRIVTGWPSSGTRAYEIVERLLNGLPAQQSRPLYRVLVWLRAYNK